MNIRFCSWSRAVLTTQNPRKRCTKSARRLLASWPGSIASGNIADIAPDDRLVRQASNVSATILRLRGKSARRRLAAYMAENTKRKWIIAVLAVVLLVGLIVALTGKGRAPRVQVANVTREDLFSAITSNGKVEPVSPTTARAEFQTFVTDVKATEGQTVRRGQVILTL